MSAAPSLYRRHRPRSFADVIGQEHVVRTLSNAIEQGQVHHAYLFVGSRGTGKTSMAKILAASLNCVNGPTVTPCGECESCRSIASASSLDVVEMDAASNNSVDDIRQLRESVAFAPTSGNYKVYILDEAHMLTTQAWNAFLKTLEEPPPNTVFVLATTEAEKVLPTVVDRCHRFDFARPTAGQIAAVIDRVAASEGIEIPEEAVALIARSATGSFRDALGTLEQLVTYSGQSIATEDVLAVLGIAGSELLFQATAAIQDRDPKIALETVSQVTARGSEPARFVRDLEAHARELMIVQTLGEVPVEIAVAPERDQRLAAQAGSLTRADILRLLDVLVTAQIAIKSGADARIQLELALVKAADPASDPTLEAVFTRLERLESGAPKVAVTQSAIQTPRPAAAPAANVPVSAPPTVPEAAEQQPVAPQVPEPEPIVSAPETAASSSSPVVDPGPEEEYEAAAETAPPVAATPVSVGGDVEQIRALWPAVLDHLRKESVLLATLLQDASPSSMTDETLTVAFPSSAAFLKRKAEDRTNKATATAAISAVAGRSITLEYELSDEVVATPTQVGESSDEGGLSQEDLIKRLISELDGEEIVPTSSTENQEASHE